MAEKKEKREGNAPSRRPRDGRPKGASKPAERRTATPKKQAEPKPRAAAKQKKDSNIPPKKQDNVKKTAQKEPKKVEKAVARPQAPKHKLRLFFLGGLHEIGKNMCAIEYGQDIIVIDAGVAFPDEEMPGVDLVIPDITYLRENADRVRAILLTHGHEDHIGAVPYVLRDVRVPVYGTRLTLGILGHKLDEIKLPKKPDLRPVEAGDVLSLGAF